MKRKHIGKGLLAFRYGGIKKQVLEGINNRSVNLFIYLFEIYIKKRITKKISMKHAQIIHNKANFILKAQ